MTPPLKSYIVRAKRTVIEDYEVRARSESDAMDMVEKCEGDFCNEVEHVDIQAEKAWENK